MTSEYRMPIESLAEISCSLSSLVVDGVIHGRTLRLAHAIDHDDQAFVPARGVIGAGRDGRGGGSPGWTRSSGEIGQRPVDSIEQSLA